MPGPETAKLTILRAQNYHLHTFEVDLDRRLARHSLRKPICREFSRIVDNKVWFTKIPKLIGCRADEHVVHEQGVVCACADDADLYPVFRVPLTK